MQQYYSDSEIDLEATRANEQEKLPAFSGRKYPIEYLDSREFERLIYFLFKDEISKGKHGGVYDTVMLMKGTAERGRDSVLQYMGKNVGVIQCKRYAGLVTLPEMCREVLKFVLNAIQDPNLISDQDNFTYHFIALHGLNEKASTYLSAFNENIVKDEKLGTWSQEVLDEYKHLTFTDYESISAQLKAILSKIKIKLVIGADIDQQLKNAKNVVPIFFEVEKVASEEMLRKVFKEMAGFQSDAELEKIRLRLQDIPEEKRLLMGLFSIYGYDRGFYQRLAENKEIMILLAGIQMDISKNFIHYLQDTINRKVLLFVTGMTNVSPFSKQVVVPFLFNKYAKKYHLLISGSFFAKLGKQDGIVDKLQTIEEIKAHLIKVGGAYLKGDYSSFYGDEELLELKISMCKFIHAGFKSTDEMSRCFDNDMVELQPVIDLIDKQIEAIMPLNPTIIIGDTASIKTEEDYINLIKSVGKYNNSQSDNLKPDF